MSVWVVLVVVAAVFWAPIILAVVAFAAAAVGGFARDTAQTLGCWLQMRESGYRWNGHRRRGVAARLARQEWQLRAWLWRRYLRHEFGMTDEEFDREVLRK